MQPRNETFHCPSAAGPFSHALGYVYQSQVPRCDNDSGLKVMYKNLTCAALQQGGGFIVPNQVSCTNVAPHSQLCTRHAQQGVPNIYVDFAEGADNHRPPLINDGSRAIEFSGRRNRTSASPDIGCRLPALKDASPDGVSHVGSSSTSQSGGVDVGGHGFHSMASPPLKSVNGSDAVLSASTLYSKHSPSQALLPGQANLVSMPSPWLPPYSTHGQQQHLQFVSSPLEQPQGLFAVNTAHIARPVVWSFGDLNVQGQAQYHVVCGGVDDVTVAGFDSPKNQINAQHERTGWSAQAASNAMPKDTYQRVMAVHSPEAASHLATQDNLGVYAASAVASAAQQEGQVIARSSIVNPLYDQTRCLPMDTASLNQGTIPLQAYAEQQGLVMGMSRLSSPIYGAQQLGNCSVPLVAAHPVISRSRQAKKSAHPSHKSPSPYMCLYPGCGKSFTRPYNVRCHARTHTAERPFSCETCGQTFSRQHDVKRHANLHLGIKPFTCDTCKRSFARMDALNRHLRSRTKRKLLNVSGRGKACDEECKIGGQLSVTSRRS